MYEHATLLQNCGLISQCDKNTVNVSFKLLLIGNSTNAPGGQDQGEWGVWRSAQEATSTLAKNLPSWSLPSLAVWSWASYFNLSHAK